MLIFTSSSILLSPTIVVFWFLNAWKVFQPTAVDISFALPCQNGRDQLKIIWVTTLWWDLCLHSRYEVAYSLIWNASKVTVRTSSCRYAWTVVVSLQLFHLTALHCARLCIECVFCSMDRMNRWIQRNASINRCCLPLNMQPGSIHWQLHVLKSAVVWHWFIILSCS